VTLQQAAVENHDTNDLVINQEGARKPYKKYDITRETGPHHSSFVHII